LRQDPTDLKPLGLYDDVSPVGFASTIDQPGHKWKNEQKYGGPHDDHNQLPVINQQLHSNLQNKHG